MQFCLKEIEKRMIKNINTHFNGQEVEAAFVGQGLGYHGLGAARRSVEQDAFGGQDPHAGEGLGMPQGPLHGLLQLQLHFFHAGYVRPADLKIENFSIDRGQKNLLIIKKRTLKAKKK